jgi:NhaC family Na+:H+ antiporter
VSGETDEKTSARLPSLAESIVVVIGGALIIMLGVFYLKQDAHIPMFICIVLTFGLGLRLGNKWTVLEEGYASAVNATTSAFLILMMVGILIGVWMLAGVITTMIDYGLALLSPKTFLIASLLICSIVSLSTGSSWATAASIGVALVGVGAGLGIHPGYTGGTIISGAYFGDKLSPLSDTTNLAPAVSGANLFDHIRAMIPTTGTSYLIALAVYAFLSLTVDLSDNYDISRVEGIRAALESVQTISPILLLPPLIVIGSAIFKVPAVLGMIFGILSGVLCGVFVQGVSFPEMMEAAQYGFTGTVEASVAGEEIAELVNGLLTRGGLQSMMWTVSLSWFTIGFGGVLETVGYMGVILNSVAKLLHKTGNLITATVVACLGVNLLVGDQYLAIVLPGRLLKSAYEKNGLAPRMLSRTLEDAGTLTSPIIPWNACGAYMAATLGIATATYAPWAILNWVNPIVAIAFGYLGIKIFYAKNEVSPGAASSEK